jgi:hypothetical protein
MRGMLAVVVALIGAVVLVSWLTHGSSPASVALPSPGASEPSATKHDAHDEVLTASSSIDERAHASPPTSSRTAVVDTSAGPHCRIFGRVVDEKDAPVPGVSIRIFPVGGRWSDYASIPSVGPAGLAHEELSTTSSDDGRFELRAPAPTATSISMSFEPDPYHACFTRQFGATGGFLPRRLVEGDNDLGDTLLIRCGAAEGRVLSEAGSPIQKAVISSDGGFYGSTNPTATTDEGGRFVLGHVTPGERALSFGGAEWMTHDEARVEVVLGAATHVPDVILKPASTVAGMVVDDSGSPLAAIRVSATSADRTFTSSTQTETDGSFVVRIKRPGKIMLFVPEQKGYRSWGGSDDVFEPGTTGVHIELAHTSMKRFKIVDAHDGRPIARFGIRLDVKQVVGGVMRAESELPLADHAGGETRLPFSGEASTVIATAPGHAAVEVDVEPDVSKTQTIALPIASSITGRVIFAGQPAAHAVITLQRDGIDSLHKIQFMPGAMGTSIRYDLGTYAGRLRALLTNPDATFAAVDLSPGTYALDFKAYGAAHKWLRTITVAPEQTLQLGDIVLDPGATVRGVLVAGADQSPIGFTVRMDGATGAERTIDGIDGKFEFTALDAGHHMISWSRPTQTWSVDDDPREQPLELVAGETRDLILDATGSLPCRVVVHVLRGGAPAPDVQVAVRWRTPRKDRELRQPLGITNESGTVEGEVDGDMRFDLIVTRGSFGELCEIASGIDAVPGGRIERTGTLSTGTLVIEVPAGLKPEKWGEIGLNLLGTDGKSRFIAAQTRDVPRYNGRSEAVWEGTRIPFGDIAAGSYDATLRFTTFDSEMTGGAGVVNRPLRDPYKTKIVIESGRETKIVVP